MPKDLSKLVKKVIVDKQGHKRHVWVRLEDNLGIKRKDMPQITDENTDGFVKWLSKKGVKTKSGSKDVHHLKPTQNELNNEKIEGMLDRAEKENDSKWLKRTVIISKDNHILDGHHRWAALKRLPGRQYIKTIQVDKPIKELVELTHKFPKVEKRTLKEFGKS